MGAEKQANTRAGAAPECGHGARLEPLAQLGDALGGVGARTIFVDVAEPVTAQTAKGGGVPRALTRKRTLGWGGGVGGALECPDSVVPRQVKCKQLRLCSLESSQGEVHVRLLRLDAAQADDLRHLGNKRQDGVHAFFTKGVVEQTVSGGRQGVKGRGVKGR